MNDDDGTAGKLLRVQENMSQSLKAIVRTLDAIKSRFPETTAEGPTKEHLEVYSVFRAYIMHEAGLINYRQNWNLSIQGFLFAAYTFTLQKVSELKVNLLVHLNSQSGYTVLNQAPGIGELHVAMVAIATVGFCVSFFVYVSVRAARLAQTELQRRWITLHPEYHPEHESKKR